VNLGRSNFTALPRKAELCNAKKQAAEAESRLEEQKLKAMRFVEADSDLTLLHALLFLASRQKRLCRPSPPFVNPVLMGSSERAPPLVLAQSHTLPDTVRAYGVSIMINVIIYFANLIRRNVLRTPAVKPSNRSLGPDYGIRELGLPGHSKDDPCVELLGVHCLRLMGAYRQLLCVRSRSLGA